MPASCTMLRWFDSDVPLASGDDRRGCGCGHTPVACSCLMHSHPLVVTHSSAANISWDDMAAGLECSNGSGCD